MVESPEYTIIKGNPTPIQKAALHHVISQCYQQRVAHRNIRRDTRGHYGIPDCHQRRANANPTAFRNSALPTQRACHKPEA